MALQTAIRKRLEDAKSERDRSQASDDVRALKEQITELKCVLTLSIPISIQRQCAPGAIPAAEALP